MHFETSPGSSPSKSIPISIRTTSSSSSSLYSNSSQYSTSSSQGSTCAYPSWPSGKSLEYRSSPSSFVSDADLFGDDCDDDYFSAPLLKEAPAPPRNYPMAQAFPILPPLYVKEKPKQQQQQPQQQQRRRSSASRKQRRTSKPMTPIAESVETRQ